MSKPKKITKKLENEYFEYLDDLRDSGVTNMYGAAPYLQSEYFLDHATAKEVLQKWMKTFSERHPVVEQ